MHGTSCWIVTDPGRAWAPSSCKRTTRGKLVAYASRSLLEHDKKCTATDLESTALIWALETFRPYIDGVHVTIRTDHAPLEYIRSKTDRCKRLARRALRLQEFRFTIQPPPGTQQKHVDALAGAPIPVESDQQPMVLDEFPERVVLLVRSWDERVTAVPAQGGPDKSERRGLERTPCTIVHRLMEKPHAQRLGSVVSEAPRDTSGTFKGPALRPTRNPRTRGVKGCSPTPRKVTTLMQLWWCRAERQTSLR